MYKISVPIMNANLKGNNREKTLQQLRRFDAERVFISLDCYELDEKKRKEALSTLSENCHYFKQYGYEVGAWIWSFWVKNNRDFRSMVSIKGTEIKEFMCPTDEMFVEFAVDYIKEIAGCGVDLIMFDDDFRYGFLGDSPACLCERHIEMINDITGDCKSREELYGYITGGGKNKYRDAYLKSNGDAFRSFARRVRAAVDEINPNIRIGACACLTSWELDGVMPKELSKILAGGTKPFIRLIGAPYWAVEKSWGNSLQDVIELERMESVWSKEDDIELMAEGDAYPRPRSICPASYLEGFDIAIRASGCTDGILKYGIDYFSNADYETGYAKFHERNKGVYSQIDSIFGGKKSVGVRVYEYPNKISEFVTPTNVNKTIEIQNLIFSKAARTLSFNTIPTVYDGDGVGGIVFDENARHIPLDKCKDGLILDIQAAEILTERGVDVGITEIKGAIPSGATEHFTSDDNRILTKGVEVCRITLSDKAKILSDTETACGRIPMSYRYENTAGNRFLVLNVNTRFGDENVLKHYSRSKQYAETVEWLSGKKLPAYVYGNPALYMQCKSDGVALSVGLWNFHADEIISPTVILGKSYSQIKFINCSGILRGETVELSDIRAFGFVGFEVK